MRIIGVNLCAHALIGKTSVITTQRLIKAKGYFGAARANHFRNDILQFSGRAALAPVFITRVSCTSKR
jgi:hypothetical protein